MKNSKVVNELTLARINRVSKYEYKLSYGYGLVQLYRAEGTKIAKIISMPIRNDEMYKLLSAIENYIYSEGDKDSD